MLQNSEIRKIYSELQKQLFYLIPEKWDRIYLYASVEEKMEGLETGELFFYYFPKGILKKNPVNVYEVPSKFSLNEEEYIKLVEKLYNEIKKLREVFKKYVQRLWNSVTIRIEGLKFEIEYNYEILSNSNYSNMDKHIIWRYNNLKLSMDIAKDSTPHVVVTVGMSEAKYNIKMGEKMEGGLGPDDKYVQRWFNNTNTIPALMECWNTIARERGRA